MTHDRARTRPPSLLGAALEYAAKGWPVFPCSRATKAPLNKHGFKDASTDEAQIRAWWERWPSANIGVPTGARIGGLAVIDVDPRHGGNESLAALEREHGALPPTLESLTGGGGRHLFFAVNGAAVRNDVGKRLGEGLDVRGEGGYVVVAPSIHETGKQYTWTSEAAPAPLPPWLAEKLAAPPPPEDQQTRGRPIPEGRRNDALVRHAGALQRRGMSSEALLAALLAENSARCKPPLPEAEVRAIAASVRRYETAAVETHIECITAAEVEQEIIEWIWPNRIPAGKLSVLCGMPDMGKSLVSIDIAARGTMGKAWPDSTNNIPAFDVMMLVTEDDLSDTVAPRITAAGADLARVHFATQTITTQGARRDERQIALDEDLTHLELLLKEHPGVRLIVIDPLGSYLGKLKKNSEEDIRQILTRLKGLAERNNVAVISVDHINKNTEQAALHRISGSIALGAVPRAVWFFVPSGKDDGVRLMLSAKLNIVEDSKKVGLRYSIESVPLEIKGVTTGVPVIKWGGAAETSLEEAFQAQRDPAERRGVRAAKWLREFLATEAKPSKDVEKAAAEKEISREALKEAKAALGVSSKKIGTTWWMWLAVEPKVPFVVPDEE